MTSRPPPPPVPSRRPEVPDAGPAPVGGWDRPIPAAPPPPGEPAGWWRRAAAAAIDAVIVLVPPALVAAALVAVVAGAGGSIEIGDEDVGVLLGLLIVIGTILLVATLALVTALVYGPLTMRRGGARNGQTWGKQLLGIRAVRMSREQYTFGAAAVREVAVKTFLFGVVGGFLAYVPTVLDYLWPLWDEQNRALHDMVVDSRVIRAYS